MIFFSWVEISIMVIIAVLLDAVLGDPKWPTHPVIYIGRFIKWQEQKLLNANAIAQGPSRVRIKGVILMLLTVLMAFAVMWVLLAVANRIHPWLGYALNSWFISTTIAVKGLKDAAMLVYNALLEGNLHNARRYVGYIVGRDTDRLDEAGAARAAIETTAENSVDAFVSPIVFALLGAAPLAMLYRASNTLDSMVGYKNERYYYFGWASARLDDALNYIPARLTGMLLLLSAVVLRGMKPVNGWRAVRVFAALHPSPNSGIPESATAGLLGIELGGTNYYFGSASERARLGWPDRVITAEEIKGAIKLLLAVRTLCLLMLTGGLLLWLLIN